MQKYQTVDPNNFHKMFVLLQKNKGQEINIYDLTSTNKLKNNQKICVKDHINKTGNNILIGNQKKINEQFVDMTNIYLYSEEGVIATCWGEAIRKKTPYSTHYLCYVSILAKAMGYKKIRGYLYNLKNKN